MWSRVGGTYPAPPHKSRLYATVRRSTHKRICQQLERVESCVVVFSDSPYDAPISRKGRRHHFPRTSPKSCMRRHMNPSGRKIAHIKRNKRHNKKIKTIPSDAHCFRTAAWRNESAPACLWRVKRASLWLQGKSTRTRHQHLPTYPAPPRFHQNASSATTMHRVEGKSCKKMQQC